MSARLTMPSPDKLGLVLSVIALLLSAGSLAYTAVSIGGVLESFKHSTSEDLKAIETKLSAKLDSVSKQVEVVAKGAGVPLADPAGMKRLLEMQDLVAAARKEGKIVHYTTADISQARKLAELFERKYPFIKVETWRGGGPAVVDKVKAEIRAGIPSADVISVNEGIATELRGLGVFQPYSPPEFEAYALKQFRLTPDTYVYSNIAAGLIYNTKKVKPADLPKTLVEIPDAKWKNRIGIPDALIHLGTAEFMIAVEKELGDKFIGWIKGLRALNPKMYLSWSPSSAAVCRGELDIAFGYAQNVHACKLAGDAVELAFVNPVGLFYQTVSFAKNAPNPNAGKLFMDFFFSIEGQRVFSDAGDIVARPDVPPAFTIPKDLKTMPYGGEKPETIKAIRDKIKAAWGS